MNREKLRYIRILRNITQEEVANELGYKSNYINMMEKGHREIKLEVLEKWIRYLNSKRALEIRDRRLKKKAEKNTENK